MSQPTDLYGLREADHNLSDVLDILPLCSFYWTCVDERHVIFHLDTLVESFGGFRRI